MTSELTVLQFCLCEEEWCFCAKIKAIKLDDAAKGEEWICDECLAGNHRTNPADER